VLAEAYGYLPIMITASKGERLLGAMPMVEIDSKFTGKRGVSLPFLDFCESYCESAASFQAMYSEAKRYGRLNAWRHLELRGNLGLVDPKTEPSLTFYNHVIDLKDGDASKVFKGLKPSAQRAVRKARKVGVQISESRSLPELREFYRLQCKTRKRHGLPPQPWGFFKVLHSRIIEKGNGSVITARLSGRPVSSSVFIEQGDTVHYKYGASDYRYQNSRSNNLVMWEAIERYANKGFRELDLGRNSMHNDSLRRYKLTWGSKERLRHYHRFNLESEKAESVSDQIYGWHNRIFNVLPIPLNRLAGRLLYPHIA